MVRFSLNIVMILALLTVVSACHKDDPDVAFAYQNFIPSHFPIPDIDIDSFPSEQKVLLGRKLFYDPIMSMDSTISCASCHDPSLAFSDDVPFSKGVGGALGTRNAPSLSNVVYQKRLLREGGLPTLEMQILVPIQEHNEFNSNIVDISEKLNSRPDYVALSMAAFHSAPNPFVITRSIAAFERILISGESKYDDFINKKSDFTPEEKLGFELFMSDKTHCSSCHGGFLFTNQTFENNGLYEVYKDQGRMRLTGTIEDEAKFKVPSLRNIAVTAPYMHDGSLNSLDEVIEHYNSGGKSHINKSSLVKPLGLSNEEKLALKAFLQTLTDENFIHNKYFRYE